MEEYSIPLQLQRLFAALSLSDQHSVPTVSLTNSFGWRQYEVGQQQGMKEAASRCAQALVRAGAGAGAGAGVSCTCLDLVFLCR